MATLTQKYNFVRTKADFQKLIFEEKRPNSPWKNIIGKDQAKKYFEQESDCLTYMECAEMCANGGFQCENGTIITASYK